MKKIFFLLLLAAMGFPALYAQQDSCNLRISLLTCTPGDELYSVFGHSAIRVVNKTSGADIIFNYGTFDFEDPSFYEKFVKGKLLYFVSVDRLENFMAEYQYFGRGVTEQELNLDCEEKQKFYLALQENAKEENKYYKYDFLLDNCSSRLRDIVGKNTKQPLRFKNILPADKTTFRDLIHEYLDKGQEKWSKLGIDMLLGMRIDRPIENQQAMFLPDYLMKGFDSAATGNKTLVGSKTTLLAARQSNADRSWFTPFVFFLILLLVFGGTGLIRTLWARKLSRLFDFLLFFLSGAIGILILFMWFGTDHHVCRDNLNILWALPTHVIAAGLLFSNRNWVRYYFLITAVLSAILIAGWIWLPQELNPALLPFIVLILIRSISQFTKRKTWQKNTSI